MRPALLSMIALLALPVACNGPDTGIPDDETDDSDDTSVTDTDDSDDSDDSDDTSDTSDTSDTGPTTGAEGSVVLIHWPADASYDEAVGLYGLFSNSNQGFTEAVNCYLGGLCRQSLPANVGEVVVHDLDLLFSPTGFRFYNVGATIALGGYEADYYYDDWYEIEYYDTATGMTLQAPGPLGLNLASGSFGAFTGTANVEQVPAVVATAPDPTERHPALSQQSVPLEWTPATTGDLYAVVIAGDFAATEKLADDGSHDLDLSSFALPETATTATVILERRTTAIVDVNGNDVEVVSTSQQYFYFDLTNVGDRTEAPGSNDCAALTGATPLAAGSYFTTVTGADNLDPGSTSCAGVAATGAEALLPVTIPAGGLVSIDFEMIGAVGAFYLLTDCDDEETCLAGKADTLGDGTTLKYFNDTDAPLDAVLVIDAAGTSTTALFDVAFSTATPIVAADLCGDAVDTTITASGRYVGSILDFGNEAGLAASNTCTGGATPGPDGFVTITVPASHRVDISYNLFNGSSSAWLTTDCASTDDEDCLAGDGDSPSSFYWVNETDAPVDVSLALDASTATVLDPHFELDVALNEVRLLALADTCTAAAALAPATAGTYTGSLASGYTDTVDPTTSGCTGYSAGGEEGIVPVTVPAGQTLTAALTYLTGEDASIYLLSDCTDTGTCVAGIDDQVSGSETLVYENTTTSDQDLFLVLDGWMYTGDFEITIELE